MKKKIATIDTSRLMEAANKAINALNEFTQACDAFGTDQRDIVISEDDFDVSPPAPSFQRALITNVEETPIGDIVNHGEWEDCLTLPMTVRAELMSGRCDSMCFGRYIFRIVK
jgi:hypothetical protein